MGVKIYQVNVNYTSNKVQRRNNGTVAEGTWAQKAMGAFERRFSKYGEVPIIGLLVGIAIGILSLIIIFSVIPLIAGTVENALPDVQGEWNTTTNPNIPSGLTLWETIGPLIVVAALIAVVAIILKLIGAF